MALGLSCGLTRVFTYNLVNDSQATPWANHGDSHAHSPNCDTNTLNVMKHLAGLLEALRAKSAGGGKNLLDRAAILCYSDMNAGGHRLDSDLPMFLAGKGDGRLVGNVCASGGNAFKMHVTALRALGLTVDGYGEKPGLQLPASQWGPGFWWTDGRNKPADQASKPLASPFNLFQSEHIREFMV